ncbi:MAG: hypothetical protein HKL92_08730 [Candidatus Eremiobacteraeota bacterium]|nr:hypothetical protein [Candidatus Eremiobacteraeota bacterium]
MSTRKGFIAVGTALAALAPFFDVPVGASAAPLLPSPGGMSPLQFDLAAFEAMLGAPATHRHLFASKLVEDGDVFDAVGNTMSAYRLLGGSFATVFPFVVLYHVAIALAFNDAIWNEIFIPSAARLPAWIRASLPSVLKPGSGNPAMHAAAGARPDDLSSIDALLAQTRLQLCVCNNALYGFSTNLAALVDESPGAVYARLTQGLVPRATVVPAGVWAVHAVQERGFTLLQTSL